MPTVTGERLPFEQAIDYFRAKVNVTTERWDDLQGEVHDVAFTTAGATSAQLLQDIRTEVDRAIAEGIAFEEFKKNFGTIVDRYGWNHNGGRDWRAQLIYRQNLYQAYAAGRYEQMTDPGMLQRRPYWQYRHGGSREPRLSHLAHNGKVYPATSPFWNSWFPPSGFGCSCFTLTLSQRDLDRLGLQPEEPPALGELVEVRDDQGQMRQVVNRPDQGFDYAPGRVQRQGRRQEVLTNMLGRLDPDLRGQVEAFIAANQYQAILPLVTAQPELVQASMETWLTNLRAIDVDDDRVMEKVYDAEYVAQEIQVKDVSQIRGLSDGSSVQAAASVFIERTAIYVEYFAKAPWSLGVYEDSRSRPEAAKVLMSRIAQESIDLGFEGRLELTPVAGAIPAYEAMGFIQGRGRYILLPEKARELIQAASEVSFMEYDYGDDLGPCVKDLAKLEEFKKRRRAEKKAEREAAQQAQANASN